MSSYCIDQVLKLHQMYGEQLHMYILSLSLYHDVIMLYVLLERKVLNGPLYSQPFVVASFAHVAW